MFLRIENCVSKKLIGFSTTSNLANESTTASTLWQQLMPRLKEVKNAVSADLFSVQVYDFDSFENFTPITEYQKYALVEVKNFEEIPDKFEQFTIPDGRYAIFLHKGIAANFGTTAQYIFGEWLPKSGFELDDRPHFSVMGDQYFGHENPDSEEEIWIPIRP